MQKNVSPAEPATVECTIWWKKPERAGYRFVAMCREGILYHWEISNKNAAASAIEEGDLVFVHYDQVSMSVFYMSKTHEDGLSAASEEI